MLPEWRASRPASLIRLAREIAAQPEPVSLVIGAAHGCIRPGLLLAHLLDADLYFVRYSLFKREDKAPIVSPGDTQVFEQYQSGRVLLFDEDVAKGTTLGNFVREMKTRFPRCWSASTIAHYLSPFQPDFVAEVLWD